MSNQVACHAGYAYAERPQAFQWEGQRHTVKQVLTQAVRPEGRWFRVLTGGDQVFELLYAPDLDQWLIWQP
jgi:hypothetical protein